MIPDLSRKTSTILSQLDTHEIPLTPTIPVSKVTGLEPFHTFLDRHLVLDIIVT
jgi:hypothetical protein